MTVTGETKTEVEEVESPVPAGGLPPPDDPGDAGASRDPGNDRGRLMLLIHDARGAASLRYLRGHTGFTRTRLWRSAEDLEDLGYVEVRREEPRGPVSRWLHKGQRPNDRIFASTFLALTEAGRNSPELAASLAAAGEARGGRTGRAGTRAAVGKGLLRLPSKLAGTLAAEWRATASQDPERRSLARLNLIVGGLGIIALSGLLACALVSATIIQTG